MNSTSTKANGGSLANVSARVSSKPTPKPPPAKELAELVQSHVCSIENWSSYCYEAYEGGESFLSAPFSLCGAEWRLQLCPNGYHDFLPEDEVYLSCHLVHCTKQENNNKSRRVQYSFRVINQDYHKKRHLISKCEGNNDSAQKSSSNMLARDINTEEYVNSLFEKNEKKEISVTQKIIDNLTRNKSTGNNNNNNTANGKEKSCVFINYGNKSPTSSNIHSDTKISTSIINKHDNNNICYQNRNGEYLDVLWGDPEGIVVFGPANTSNSTWGAEELIPLTVLNGVTNGYILNDTLLIVIEIEIYDTLDINSHPLTTAIEAAAETKDLIAIADADLSLIRRGLKGSVNSKSNYSCGNQDSSNKAQSNSAQKSGNSKSSSSLGNNNNITVSNSQHNQQDFILKYRHDSMKNANKKNEVMNIK